MAVNDLIDIFLVYDSLSLLALKLVVDNNINVHIQSGKLRFKTLHLYAVGLRRKKHCENQIDSCDKIYTENLIC